MSSTGDKPLKRQLKEDVVPSIYTKDTASSRALRAQKRTEADMQMAMEGASSWQEVSHTVDVSSYKDPVDNNASMSMYIFIHEALCPKRL